ncbi:MAG TPA: hypothetical protein VGV35_12105, partial [Bryobacteraceae bacterium]|nr:hypothetical protein [Bryobacteraceae bacterium]
MPSNLHKLSVDEQYFHNVLYAAFTIQEYNDRKSADPPLSHDSGGSNHEVIDQSAGLGFISGLDAPQEPIAANAAGQLVQEDDLIAPHGDGTA